MRQSAIANSTTTSARRKPRLPVAILERPPSLSDSFRFKCEARQAGAVPKRTPARVETVSVKRSTGTCMRKSASLGNVYTGTMARMPWRIISDRAIPPAPPTIASVRLSVKSWRKIRKRPAPIADRTAISLSRVAARDSMRLATFTQAMSKTKPTAPKNNQSSVSVADGSQSSCSGSTVTVQFFSTSGCAAAICCATRLMSASACAAVTAGRIRATTQSQCSL